MSYLEISNVTKIYEGSNPAVSDVSLSIDKGEFVVLVGPSGCGKSTLLRMIAGLEEITSGTISLDGKVLNDVEPRDRDIAMVFQNYALYPHLSVFDNMAFSLKMRKVPKDQIAQKVDEVAETLGLKEYLHRKPRALSGGQRQRVAVGRAIVRDPKVFLFDEPLSNLDANMRLQMRAELRGLHARLKSTMVYVTHDQVEAMTMGTRIVVLKDGEMQQFDTPLKVYHDPRNAFVASFIGAPPMNLLTVSIKDDHPQAQGMVLGPKLSGTALKSSKIGVRPQDILLDNDSQIQAKVELVEPLGAESVIHARIGSETIVIVTPGEVTADIGGSIGLRWQDNAICYFDEKGLKLG